MTTNEQTLKPFKGCILIFSNLNVAVCGEDGQQIPELQKSLPTLLAEHFERCGYDAEGALIETNEGNWKLRRTKDGGWNRDRA